MLKELAVLAGLVALTAAYSQDGDVLALTDDDFPAILEEFPNILIEFYAPWCGHCKKLAPVYAEVATALKARDSKIRLAKVNCDEEEKAKNTYGVKGFPTLLYFTNGKSVKYEGGRTKEAMEKWLLKRENPAFTLIEEHQVESLPKDQVKVIFRFNRQGSNAKAHLEVLETLAQEDDNNGTHHHTVYYLVHSEAEEFVEIHRNFSGPVKSSIAKATLKGWIALHEEPEVVDLSEKTLTRIFQQGQDALILFNEHRASDLSQVFLELSQEWRQTKVVNLIFTELTKDSEHFKGLAAFMKVDITRIPVVFLKGEKREKVPLILAAGEAITKGKISSFLTEKDTLKSYDLDEEIPEVPFNEEEDAQEL